MAIVVGLTVGLFLLLGFHLLGAGFRNPRWLIVAVCLLLALYKYGQNQLVSDIQDIGLIAVRSADCTGNQLQVVVANGRANNITGLSFFLRGFRPNYSEHVAFAAMETDRVVPAGQSWVSCWDIAALKEVPMAQRSTLRWEVEITAVEFAE
mgnify:CR=1 FL=1